MRHLNRSAATSFMLGPACHRHKCLAAAPERMLRRVHRRCGILPSTLSCHTTPADLPRTLAQARGAARSVPPLRRLTNTQLPHVPL